MSTNNDSSKDPVVATENNTDQHFQEDNISYTDSEKLVHNKKWEQSNIEELLRCWGERAGGLRWMHVHSATHWRFVDDRMNYIGITLSSIISASSLTGVVENFVPQNYVMLFIGIIGMLNMLNQSLQRFYRSSEKASLHESAAKQFGNFNRFVATKLSLSRLERGPPKQVLDFALKENERLHKENLDPHFRSIRAFKKEFGSRANQNEFSIPDLVADTFKLQMYNERRDNVVDVPIKHETSFEKRVSLWRKFNKFKNKEQSEDISNI